MTITTEEGETAVDWAKDCPALRPLLERAQATQPVARQQSEDMYV